MFAIPRNRTQSCFLAFNIVSDITIRKTYEDGERI